MHVHACLTCAAPQTGGSYSWDAPDHCQHEEGEQGLQLRGPEVGGADEAGDVTKEEGGVEGLRTCECEGTAQESKAESETEGQCTPTPLLPLTPLSPLLLATPITAPPPLPPSKP